MAAPGFATGRRPSCRSRKNEDGAVAESLRALGEPLRSRALLGDHLLQFGLEGVGCRDGGRRRGGRAARGRRAASENQADADRRENESEDRERDKHCWRNRARIVSPAHGAVFSGLDRT